MKQIVGVFKGSNIVHNYGVHFCFESQVSHWQPITNDFRTMIAISPYLQFSRDWSMESRDWTLDIVTGHDGTPDTVTGRQTP